MTRNKLLILAAAVAGLWWYRRRQSSPGSQAPISVNASTQIVQEDDTAEALSDLVKAISVNPDLRTTFQFFGKGVDLTFTQSPPPGGIRKGIGGQPTIIIP